MASALASKQNFKSWLRKTQPLFLASISENQETLMRSYDCTTSICIEVNHVFYNYEFPNRGKNMLFSALKAIHTKHGSVDVYFENRQVKKWSDVDGYLIVYFKSGAPDDRGRKIAYIHVMKKDTSTVGPDNDEVCNFLDDLSDDSDNEDSKQGQLDGGRDDVSHDPGDEDEYGFSLFD